jgi:hypothetical protein
MAPREICGADDTQSGRLTQFIFMLGARTWSYKQRLLTVIRTKFGRNPTLVKGGAIVVRHTVSVLELHADATTIGSCWSYSLCSRRVR